MWFSARHISQSKVEDALFVATVGGVCCDVVVAIRNHGIPPLVWFDPKPTSARYTIVENGRGEK